MGWRRRTSEGSITVSVSRSGFFVGSEQGGHTAAAILTLITSAVRHQLDPFAYLRDLLRRLPTSTERDPVNLLINRWKPK